MNKITLFRRQGFTLMELLIVLAIVMALFAIVLPTLFKSRTKSLIKQAEIQIGQLEGNLELYATENRGYPTTEQGLLALIYFPDNQTLAMTSPNFAQQPSGMNPAGMDPNAAFAGNAMTVGGAGTFGNPAGTPMGSTGAMGSMGTPNTVPNPMIDPTGMGMGGTGMGMTNPMPGNVANPMGSANPMDPMGGAMATADPMNPMSGTFANTWNQPFHNPQIYAQQRKRPSPYLDSEKSLLDPWGHPYRYDNSLQYYGLNKTGEVKPAIWSAGPDGRDGNEDDILNYDANEAQQRFAQHQQQLQNGMGTMGTNPVDMMGNPMSNPMSNSMDPTGMGMMNQPMNPQMNQPMNPMMSPGGISNPPGMVNPMGGTANPMNDPGMSPPMMPNTMPNTMPNPMTNPMTNPTM